jgi:uncharacterized protein (TIGR03067 family)
MSALEGGQGMRLGFLATVMAVLLAAGAPGEAADAKKKAGLRGTWTAVSAERNGVPADDIKGHRLTLTGDDRFTIRSRGKLRYGGTFRIDLSRNPATIDFTHTRGEAKGKVWQGIYLQQGDGMKICDNADDVSKGRPAAFATEPGSGRVLVIFRRATQ